MIRFAGDYKDSPEVSEARSKVQSILFNRHIPDILAEKAVEEFNNFAKTQGVPNAHLLITRAQARTSWPVIFMSDEDLFQHNYHSTKL